MSDRRKGACSAPTRAYAFMKRHDQDGRAGCSIRGSTSAATLNTRLTGAEGIRRAKCTRSLINRRGFARGSHRPFGSCIHAPQRRVRASGTSCRSRWGRTSQPHDPRGDSKREGSEPTRNHRAREGERRRKSVRTNIELLLVTSPLRHDPELPINQHSSRPEQEWIPPIGWLMP